MVHVAPSRSLLVVQRVRGGHEVLDDVGEAEVALVKSLELGIGLKHINLDITTFLSFSQHLDRFVSNST